MLFRQNHFLSRHSFSLIFFVPKALSHTIYLLKIVLKAVWDYFTSLVLSCQTVGPHNFLYIKMQTLAHWIPKSKLLEGLSAGRVGISFLLILRWIWWKQSKHLLNASHCLFNIRQHFFFPRYRKRNILGTLCLQGSSAHLKTDRQMWFPTDLLYPW